jgi:transcriptional regulator with XRE-family HTH domain
MADAQDSSSSPVALWAPQPPGGPGGLGRLLLAYRAATGLTQAEFGELLGFTQSYLSRLERGERTIRDAGTLRRIAAQLGIPAQLLGVTDPDIDQPVSLELARPALRLASLARQAGHAMLAAQELWPVVAMLETEHARGRGDMAFLRLLTDARLTFGTTLGHVLPTERLGVVVAWTQRALESAVALHDPAVEAQVRRMHGNELRKAGRPAQAIAQLRQAATLTPADPAARGAALVLAARAAAEAGNPRLFDHAAEHATRLLETAGEQAPLFTRYALGEVQLRGAVRLHRHDQVARLLEARPGSRGTPPSPQWQVLDAVTRGEALLAMGETTPALADLTRAVPAAADAHLPQQLGRITQTLTEHEHEPAARELAALAQARLEALSPVVVTPP